MSSDKPSSATPVQVEARSGSNERIVPKGTVIDFRDDENRPMCCLILSGSVAVEISGGTVLLNELLQGETFNEQYVFSNYVDSPVVRYRALTRCALRVFDRGTILANEDQTDIRELYRAVMRTHVRQNSDVPRRVAFVLGEIRDELERTRENLSEATEALAEKEQELTATTEQMTSAQTNLEQARGKMAQMSQELKAYQKLVKNHEAALAKVRGELKAAKMHEAEVITLLQDEIKNAQDATRSTQDHMGKIHKALERLSARHSEIRMDKEIMFLWLGEDPLSNEDLDLVFERCLSEPPSKPAATLIPDSGVPEAALGPIPQNHAPKLSALQVPRPALRPPARFVPPIPREEPPDPDCMQVQDSELSPALPPPRSAMSTIGFDPSEAPTEPFRDIRGEEAVHPMLRLDSVPPDPGPPTIPPSSVQCAPVGEAQPIETTREMDLSEFRHTFVKGK